MTLLPANLRMGTVSGAVPLFPTVVTLLRLGTVGNLMSWPSLGHLRHTSGSGQSEAMWPSCLQFLHLLPPPPPPVGHSLAMWPSSPHLWQAPPPPPPLETPALSPHPSSAIFTIYLRL